MRTLLLLTATLAALAITAGNAAAAVFCVDHDVANCPAGSNTSHGADLDAAFVAAAATTTPDTVVIGAGTYDSIVDSGDQAYSANATNPVTIVGAGSDKTTLTTSAATTPDVFSVGPTSGHAELSGVTITAQGNADGVLDAAGANIHDIAVTGSSTALNPWGVRLSYSDLRHSSVTFDGRMSVVSANGTGNQIEDVRLSGATFGVQLAYPSTGTYIHRATIAGGTPVSVDNASGSIDDSLLFAGPAFGTTLGIEVDG